MDSCRFVADVHLAKVAKYLRILGIDTLYFHEISDDALLVIANEQNRIVLTRDRKLASRSERVYYVPQGRLDNVVGDIVRRFGCECDPLTRCLVDNTPLVQVAKEEIYKQLPPKVREWCDLFWRCPTCGRIYWRGTHYERMLRFARQVCGIPAREP